MITHIVYISLQDFTGKRPINRAFLSVMISTKCTHNINIKHTSLYSVGCSVYR